MKLWEHPDFDAAVLAAADYFRSRGIRPAWVEKDYFVTEALRAISDHAKDRVIFKGGKSLSKGWNLIERFSEDIDIFLPIGAGDSRPAAKLVDRELKALRDAIVDRGSLEFSKADSRTHGGAARNDVFLFATRFGGPGEVAPRVLVESGIASGREPFETRPLNSLVGEFLVGTGQSLDTEDEGPFEMRLLHFRRTFVEKLFAIHKRVEMSRHDGTPIGPHARHYYVLFQLSGRDEVRQMLESTEYEQIRADYKRISLTFFPEHYREPKAQRFSNSQALFPPDDLARALADEYESQCRMLCHGTYPTWAAVLGRFEELRPLL